MRVPSTRVPGCTQRSARLRQAFCALLILTTSFPSFAAKTVAAKKKIAYTAFEQAERQREALNGRPEAQRTRRDYQRVIEQYRKVYYTAPSSVKADAAVLAVAELMAEAGAQFDDAKLSRDAIGQYEFLRREYPGSKHRFGALLAIGQVYQDDLGDKTKAKATFEEFLRRYPNHADAGEAKNALAEMKKPSSVVGRRSSAKTEEPKTGEGPARAKAQDVIPPFAPKSGAQDGAPASVAVQARETATTGGNAATDSKQRIHVTGVRHWSTPEYTRVAIDLDSEVKFDVGHVPSPERIFFDLHGTRLASGLMGKEFEVESGLLKKVRVAQFLPGETRVVLEVGDQADYETFFLPNPYRLIVDIRAKKEAKSTAGAAVPHESSKSTAGAAVQHEPSRSTAGTAVTHGPSTTDAAVPHGPSAVEAPARARAEIATETTATIDPSIPLKPVPAKPVVPPPTVTTTAKKNTPRDPSVREARPTSDGDRSLIRALGLKIGRIVIDAGHGGHDTGTIGPTGFTEKELVLDVALRLGKLLEQRLSADVVYTRDDDTFIPLETRTAIANRENADLFLSIHANSSRDASARGVETYYLNFTSDAGALEVAARENAVSDTSIHELQDLVKKIALKEKIEESREFASDVQKSLQSGLSTRTSAMRDRGVKKAPFVVLIGANMPSVLAEISFVSNPGDERKLKTADYRQKIAESLYRGMARYVSGLSGVKVASAPKAAGQ